MTGRILLGCAMSSILGTAACGDDTSTNTDSTTGPTGSESTASSTAETTGPTTSATTAETSASTTADTTATDSTSTETTATGSTSTESTSTDSTSTESTSTQTGPSDTSSDTGSSACCDPDAMPDCMDNEEVGCCADGWACLEIGGEVCAPGIVCDGERCQGPDESCANGESCCGGLDCCAGLPVPPGQEFCSQVCPVSDRNRKRDFEMVDTAAVLEKVAALPITTWSYKFEDPSIRHIGPMAQDFRAAFGVGRTEKLIFQIDADGVALASIQALHAKIEVLEGEKAALQTTLESLEQRLAKLEARD